MLPLSERLYVDSVPRGIQGILVADIGGTNSNFAVYQYDAGELTLLFSLHMKSQQVTNFTTTIGNILKHVKDTYDISIAKACFAAAGVVSEKRDYSKPTNLDVAIDAQDIIKHTSIECASLVNDFEVIGYGLSKVAPDKLIEINKGTPLHTTNKAIVGAGTGLGKCIMFYERDRGHHVPVASEGGHADFAAQNEIEFALSEFIKNEEQRPCNISWEDVLSGNGIQRIYTFFRQRNSSVPADKDLVSNGMHPDEIFNNRNRDEHAHNTFELYAHLYARCAKNFALDALARGGVYIAGGIASKNIQLFQLECFMREFVNCGKQMELLKNIPIYVIADYNVSLYGVAEYMRLEGVCD